MSPHNINIALACKRKRYHFAKIPISKRNFFSRWPICGQSAIFVLAFDLCPKPELREVFMVQSKLGGFIQKLADGKGSSSDPFDEDFFDMKAHLKEKEDEEPAVIEQAFERAKKRGELLEKAREQSKFREVETPKPYRWSTR